MEGIKPIDHPQYCWERTKGITYTLGALKKHAGTCRIVNAHNVTLALLQDDKLALRKGYAHNGCSMSPDFHNARRGCEAHDALVQMLQRGATSFTLEQANNALLELQKRDNFKLSKLYRWATGTWFARKFMKL